ncbi:glycosyltransferase family 4 protein [Bacillus sp. HMF5848]|nr:glycosyltransferase family 4 protein [Bacillus sp. HMF5848]
MYPTNVHKSFGIFVKNQVEALRNHGLAVDVAAIRNPRGGKLNVIKKYSGWFLQTLSTLLAKGKQYHVVHAHYVFPSGLLALFFKQLFGTKMIVTAHGGDIDKMARKNARIFNMTKKIMHKSDHVIAVGQELYDTITKEFNVPSDKVSIINMGVNRSVFKPVPKKEAKQTCGIQANITPILFVGNILKQKGLLELAGAMKGVADEITNAHLYLIGAEKDESFKKELVAQLTELGVESSVTFLGVKTQQDIAQWMNAADLFVLPSHIEGFGLVALEAMSCGTPVVGTAVGGLKYLLADGAGELVAPKDTDALKEGLIRILSSNSAKHDMINKSIMRAEENDQERMIQKVIEVYFPTGG